MGKILETILFLLVIFLPFVSAGYVIAQPIVLEENFESGDLSRNPEWTGDLDDFIFITESDNTLLKLDSKPEPSRTQIRTSVNSAYGSWEFYFRQEFTASNLNRSFIFLMADREDLNYLDGSRINGYAIRTGENGDPKRIRLIRFDGGTQQEILASHTVLEAGTGYRVKVTRNRNGEWQIHTGEGFNSTPLQDSETVVDTTYTESESGYFGFLLRYTTANTDRFYFGDIRVVSDPGPLEALEIRLKDMQTLAVQFNRPPDPSSLDLAVFQLESGSRSVYTEMRGDDTVLLSFQDQLHGGPDALTIDGLRDFHGFETDPAKTYELLLALPVLPGDVVINEIMFDPLRESENLYPGQSEYLELLNRRDHAISLAGFHLRDQAEITPVTTIIESENNGDIWIQANGYLLLYPENETSDFQSSRIAQFFDLPSEKSEIAVRFDRTTLSLPISGRTIVLSDQNGILIDRVDYKPEWHNPNLIDTRGIALERIDPDHESDDPSNWSSSTTPAGGTPGRQNTLFQFATQNPDNTGLILEPNPFSPDGDGHEDHLFINYKLEEPDYMMRVRIFDRYGRLVRTISDSRPAGYEGSLIWDGRTDDGQNNRIGIYIVFFEAFNSSSGRNRIFRETVVIARQF